MEYLERHPMIDIYELKRKMEGMETVGDLVLGQIRLRETSKLRWGVVLELHCLIAYGVKSWSNQQARYTYMVCLSQHDPRFFYQDFKSQETQDYSIIKSWALYIIGVNY